MIMMMLGTLLFIQIASLSYAFHHLSLKRDNGGGILGAATRTSKHPLHAIKDDVVDATSSSSSGSSSGSGSSDSSSDKLIFDKQANRFFETDTSSVLEEQFCLIDKESGEKILLTREEKERVFLDCIQSFYYSGGKNSALTDDQFNLLRNDLSWEGSALVTLSRNETLFMNAIMAYNKGTPILSNPEFDDLKRSLRESKSKIAVDMEPKCYVETGVCKVTWSPDTIRTSSLYVPATLFLTTIYLGVFYELPFIRGFFNPLFLLIVGALPIYNGAKKITEEFLFKNPSIATGPCPKCGVENRIFFGDVLGVEGDDDESSLKCTNCKTSLTVKKATLRVSTLSSPAGPPKKAATALAATATSDD